jgi:hypothetical protein
MARSSKLRLLSSKLSTGQLLLGAYIAAVIVVAVIRDTVGNPVVIRLASTPSALAHGAWWQLFTSGLVVDGPILPQVLAVAVLGALSIYFRGSLLFWLTALIGHIFGTLITYLGVGVAWLIHPSWVSGLLRQEDYGISLIWCAALGMVAAAAWLGPDSSRRHFYRPTVALGATVIMTVVTWYSVGLARYEHLTAFALAFLIVSLTPQHKHISKRLERRPRVRKLTPARSSR